MSDRPKFAVHPGNVRSKTDGDVHYITARALVRLYELRPSEYIVWIGRMYGVNRADYVHLYPRYDGKYGRPS